MSAPAEPGRLRRPPAEPGRLRRPPAEPGRLRRPPAEPGRLRRGRPGYDLESLLEVAVGLFNERGYEATTMEDLARRLGVTKSAIYHHVSGKAELLRLAVDRALGGLFAVVDETIALPLPAVERLERLLQASVVVLVDALPFVTLLLRVRGNTPAERLALDRRRQLDGIVTDLVAEAAADGDLRADVDPATTGRLLFGMVNSLTEWYRPGGGVDAAQLGAAVAEIAFEGLRVQNRRQQLRPGGR